MQRYTRRGLLGAAGAGAAGSLAGCGMLSGDSGTTVTTEQPPLPYTGSTSPPYRPWVYAPQDGGTYTFAASKLSELSKSAIDIGDLPFREISAVQIADGISVARTDFARVLPAGFVITGDYQLGPLEENLEVQSLSPTEEYKTVTLWTGESADIAVGVKPGLVIRSGSSSRPPVELVKLLIDTATGGVDRYTNINDTCEELVSRLPAATALAGRPAGAESLSDTIDFIEGVEGTGISWDIGQETATVKHLFVYPDPGSVEPGTVETFVRDQEFFEGFSNIQVQADGRVAVMTADVGAERVGRPLLPPWMPAGMNQNP